MTTTPEPAGPVSSALPDRTEDIALIRRAIATVEKNQRDRDADAFMRLLARDAVWVTALGKRLTGWDEINSFTRKVLTPALGDHYATYEIAHVIFLCETVAAVNVIQKPVDESGSPDGGEPEGRPLYVMTKGKGDWVIAIGQNTGFRQMRSMPNPEPSRLRNELFAINAGRRHFRRHPVGGLGPGFAYPAST